MRISETSRVGGAGLLALVATYGIGRQAYGLFVPAFREEFDLSLDVLGFYASAAQAGYLIATVVAGVLTARLGPRVPVVAGCLLLAAGAATVAVAPGPLLLAIGVTATGTSAGGAWAPFSDAIDNQVPPSGTGRALALANAGSPVGLVVASALVLLAGDEWRIAWWAFAAIGLLVCVAAWRVMEPSTAQAVRDDGRPPLGWFLNRRSARLLVVASGLSITSGAFFAYAPDTAEDAGQSSWIGPAMWAVLGVAGVAVGVFGRDVADRYGFRTALFVMLVLVGGSNLMLLTAADSTVAALGSAALFGVGFTTGFALVAMWNQQVFPDRPTTGFTMTIVFIALGFVVGPSLFGVIATQADRPTAIVATAVPAILVTLVPTDVRRRRPGSRAVGMSGPDRR